MIGQSTFAIVGLLFLLAQIRTFIATLYQTWFGVLPNNTLGAIAIAAFASAAFAPLLARTLGARRALALSALALGLSTVLATAARNNALDLALSAIGVVSGLWWLVFVHAYRTSERGSPLPVALPLALVTDFALRHAFRTVPVVDVGLALAVPLVLAGAFLFLAAGLATLASERAWVSPGGQGALALAGVGTLVIVGELSATNAAQVALAAGLGFGPEPARSTQIGALAIGIGIAAGSLLLTRAVARRPIAAGLLVAGGALLWLHVPLLSLVGGALLACGFVVAASVLVTAPATPSRGALAIAIPLAIGWIAFVAVAFVFYAFYAVEAAWVAIGLVALHLLVAPAVSGPRLGFGAALLIGAIAVVVPLVALVPFASPPTAAPLQSFRLMTYNVHQGFDNGQVPSLDALSETIARESPDVLVLQEVSRGWLLTEQHDVLGVLAERLGMHYVWGPTIGDLYGNAILSRMPMTEVRRVAFPREASVRHQPRGALVARIADVQIIVTHLDQNADASDVRLRQIRAVLSAWNGASPAIVAGDLNALPEAFELRLLDEAGFSDLVLAAGSNEPTFPSDKPERRIDYIFGIGLNGSQPHTVPSTASDHRAVVVNITRLPQR